MATPHYTQRVKLEMFVFAEKDGRLLGTANLHCKITEELATVLQENRKALEKDYGEKVYYEFIDGSTGDLIENSIHLNRFMKEGK
jgi:hypothetical protein